LFMISAMELIVQIGVGFSNEMMDTT
jgi:hypothetical protein